MEVTGGECVVKTLEHLGVKRVFGIPGAKIDSVFNALEDSNIEVIVCRHEQNACFMAAAYGRLTGKPGVVLVTSGPGVANMATGLLTATTEGDPILAIGGNVASAYLIKGSHQNTENVKLMEPVTKSSVEAKSAENISEVLMNAHRIASQYPRGSCFVSLPQDILSHSCTLTKFKAKPVPRLGSAKKKMIQKAAGVIQKSKQAVLFCGQDASQEESTESIRVFLNRYPMPVFSTFQAAGVISADLMHLFMGRVGLFQNQPGDEILIAADTIICVGFNSIEYDPEIWNKNSEAKIIDINTQAANIRNEYQPEIELVGDIALTMESLSKALPESKVQFSNENIITPIKQAWDEQVAEHKVSKVGRIHPLDFIKQLQSCVKDEDLVVCDIGSIYM